MVWFWVIICIFVAKMQNDCSKECIEVMKIKNFFAKFVSPFLLLNLLAMFIVVLVLLFGINYQLEAYTHHGEGIEIPNLYGMDVDEAADKLQAMNLSVEVTDTGYVKTMDANCILVQMPGAGTKVKEGRTVYVTINSTTSPRLKIPDIIDNSSYREAQARLTAVGFQLGEPKVIDGERDWVYGLIVDGRDMHNGDMVSIESLLTLVIGNGTTEDEDADDMVLDVPETEGGEEDEFYEIVE